MAASLVNKILPAYPFVQYRDDEDISAFFNAYNDMAQIYLDSLNNLGLPCWTSPAVTGFLLDWIALGIYGEERPLLQVSEEALARGAYDTVEYNAIPYAKMSNYVPGSATYVHDDFFKRVLTWNFYKGDGSHFNIEWLKRRIARFVHGKDGVDPPIQSTFDVSVTVQDGVFSVVIPEYGDGAGYFLQGAIEQHMVKLPFIYSFSTMVIEK